MKIALLSSVFAPIEGGSGMVAQALAEAFPREITVVAPRHSKSGPDGEPWDVYDARFPFAVWRTEKFQDRLPVNVPRQVRGPMTFAWNVGWTRPRVLREVLRMPGLAEADVVCVTSLIPCYWIPAELKRRYPRMKSVFLLHGEEVADGSQATRLDALAHTQLREADGVVTVSRFTGELAAACGVDRAKIRVVHNGVDTERFTPGAKDAELERRWGLAGKRVLLCLARLDERKGQDMLIAAMPEILAAVPNAVLLIVGGGGDERRLRALAARAGGTVIFAGRAADEELVRYYRTADVFAMPNRTMANGDTEGFGLVFLEAGACGKPVVGGDAGGVPEAIDDGVTGLVVDGTSIPAVVEACVRLLQDGALAERMGAAGLAKARAQTWRRQAERFVAYCAEIARR